MLIERAIVVTVNETDEILDPGWIAVRNGRIAAIAAAPIGAEPGEERLDLNGKVVIPGLINAHTHLFQVLIRGIYDDLPFSRWLSRIYHSLPALTPVTSRMAAMLGAVESVRSGVTTLVDHQFLNRGTELADATIAGVGEVGLRLGLARTIMDQGGLAPREALETPEAGLSSVEELLRRHRPDRDRMLTIMTGPNTPGVSATAQLAAAAREFAEHHRIRRSAHVSESTDVLDAVESQVGHRRVFRWLDDVDGLGRDLLAAHSVHVSSDEMRLMAERRVSVSHNPVSNMFLGDGIAPVAEMISVGVNVALGTDGAASNNTQDMFETMKAAALLHRLRTRDAAALPPSRVLRMATINAARALGLDDVVGSIEVGKDADLAVVDLHRSPHCVAVHDVLSALVYSARAADVETVMVRGKLLMRGRQLLDVDEQKVLADGQAVAQQARARLEN